MATENVKYAAPETQTTLKTKVFPRPGQHTTGIVDWLPPSTTKNWVDVWPVRFVLSFVGWTRGIAYPFAIVESQHGGSH